MNKNKFMLIKERIVYFADLQDKSKEDFFKEIGMTSANFRGKALKTPLNSNAIENIFSIYPNINLEWLITGNGNVFKTGKKPARNIASEPESVYGGTVDYIIDLVDMQKKHIGNLDDKVKRLEDAINSFKNRMEAFEK